MSSRELTLERWKGLKACDRESICGKIERELPTGFAFRGIRTCVCGEVSCETGFFEYLGRIFCLVPGGEFTLGFDLNRQWEATQDELDHFDEEDWGKSITEYLEAYTLRPRKVHIKPLLVEVLTSKFGWKPLSREDPAVREIAGELSETDRPIFRRDSDRLIRVEKDSRGNLSASEGYSWRHHDVVENLQSQGFRLLTSNEWEYVCAAGASTLFRWGDHVPCSRICKAGPLSSAEVEWHREFIRTGGNIEYPLMGFDKDWNWSRRPNAFGLSIASDSYVRELVLEPGVLRGGDGGYRACGGHCVFSESIVYATSYFEEMACKYDVDSLFPPDPNQKGTVLRRVIELD